MQGGSGNIVRMGGVPVYRPRHVAAFFHNKNEEYDVLLPFIQEGFLLGDKAYHIVDTQRQPEHRRRLLAGGLDVLRAEKTGQLEIHDPEDTFLRDGYFDEKRQLRFLEEILTRNKALDYRLTRLVADMEWAVEGLLNPCDLVSYEAHVNYLLPKYDDALVCVYDLARFGADIIMDVFRAHAVVLLGGRSYLNPFFVPADALLRELEQRRERTPS